jgi:hypothetical protein
VILPGIVGLMNRKGIGMTGSSMAVNNR